MLRVVSFSLVAALACIGDAHAKAYHAPLPEAERRMHAVAIVDVVGISDNENYGAGGYRRLVQGDVVDVVAGTLPRRIEILGSRDFVCAPVTWQDGKRYLAMLEHFGEHWIATNNERGRIEIIDGKLAWPYDDTNELVPVEDVVAMLETRLEPRIGRGRFADEGLPLVPVAPDIVVMTPPPDCEAPEPVDDPSPAPWIAIGAIGVALGFVVDTRRRRPRAPADLTAARAPFPTSGCSPPPS